MASLRLCLSAMLLTACLRQSPPPQPGLVCPEVEVPACPEPTVETRIRTRVIETECPPTRASSNVPGRTADSTCVTGRVQTAGNMVMEVQRARVTLASGGTVLAESWTDNAGRYVVCVGSRAVSDGASVTIEVRKPPFTPAARSRVWAMGQHHQVGFSLEAAGLTDEAGD